MGSGHPDRLPPAGERGGRVPLCFLHRISSRRIISHQPVARTDHRAAHRTAQHRLSDPRTPVRARIIFVTTLTLDYTIRVHADRVRAVKNADADNKSRAGGDESRC